MDGSGDYLRSIPGFHASRGDRVHKALQKLWDKIKDLEQKTRSEHGRSQASSTVDFDDTMEDVQSKLLELQLKHIRKLMRERARGQAAAKSVYQEIDSKAPSSSTQKIVSSDSLDMFPVKLQKETQNPRKTIPRSSVFTNQNEDLPHVPAQKSNGDFSEKVLETECQVHAGCFLGSSSSDSLGKPTRKTKVQPYSHYHVKMSDIPFIVGQSTGASHSLTANVQSIISLMKTHSPALCKPSAERLETYCNATEPYQGGAVLKEVKKGLRRLAKELSDLTVKQESLKQKLESSHQNAQNDQNDALREEYSSISKLMITKAREIVDFHKQLKNEHVKTSSEDVPAKEVSEQTQKNEIMSTGNNRKPMGRTIAAGRVKTLSSFRPARGSSTSGQLKASDVVWM